MEQQLQNIINSNFYRMVLSKPKKEAEYKKAVIRPLEEAYLFELYTKTQVFHVTVKPEDLMEHLLVQLKDFLQLNAWNEDHEFMLLISKKGKLTSKTIPLQTAPKKAEAHNREKTSLLPEGAVIAPLVDMGIMNDQGIIHKDMLSKFRQINRFLELIDDVVKPEGKTFRIIDSGCGKSYLTFILYYYFVEVKKLDVELIGIDVRADVIEKSNAVKEKYGYSGMRFLQMRIEDFSMEEHVDMLISLHACDTATDYMLYNAVRFRARTIFSVPCCQHEIRAQLELTNLPLFKSYGLMQERFSTILTDSIRADLLESVGYKTQLIEFVNVFDTPKNVLIRAVLSTSSKAHRLERKQRVEQAMQMFSITPCLYELLYEKAEK